MFCSRCGAQRKDDARFCVRCGRELPAVPVDASAVTPAAGPAGAPGARLSPGKRAARITVVTLAVLLAFGVIGAVVDDRPKRIAKEQFHILMGLANSPPAGTLAELVPWQQRLASALHVIDSDPKVLDAFKELLAHPPRSAVGAARAEPILVGARLLAADDALSDLRALTNSLTSSSAWQAFVDAAKDPGRWIDERIRSKVRQITYGETKIGEAARSDTGWEQGANPKLSAQLENTANMFPARGECTNGTIEDKGSGNCVADFSGTWQGRWSGTKRSPAGKTCTLKGSVTFTLRQNGPEVTGSASFSDFYYLYETCEQRDNGQGTGDVSGRVDGFTLTLPNMWLRKASPNSLDGRYGADIQLFVARQA